MLTDGSINLRRLKTSDSERIANLANNRKISNHLRDIFPYPYGIKDAEFFIDSVINEDPQVTFAIEYHGDLCGVIGLVPQKDVYSKCAEIGYWLGEPYWGKGIATRAVKLIIEYGFKNLHLIRIHTGVFDGNIPSMRVLEKNGFKKEGVFNMSLYLRCPNPAGLPSTQYNLTFSN